jgi:uncharacterized membrane protein
MKGGLKMFMLKSYLLTVVVFFAIDLTWLGLIAKKMYADKLGFIMSPQVNWVPAILFYLLFVIGLLLMVILPAIEKKSWTHALLYGILFGLVTYATYDLTNLATLKNWPVSITIIDLIWGAFLSAATSVISFFAIQKFL